MFERDVLLFMVDVKLFLVSFLIEVVCDDGANVDVALKYFKCI